MLWGVRKDLSKNNIPEAIASGMLFIVEVIISP